MKKLVLKAASALDSISSWMATFATGVMWLVMCYAVIMRYVFHDAPVWGDELCRFCLVWLTFYGGAVALRGRSLANMTLLVDCFPPKVRKWINIFVEILGVALLAAFTIWSLKLTLSKSVMIQKSPAMHLPLPIVYSCMPISLALMTFQQILLVLEDIYTPAEEKKTEVEKV